MDNSKDNKVRTYQYGLPDSIITRQRWGQSYCSYQAEDYGFSPQTGNLMYRSGIVGGGYPQQYTYDTADRLTLVQEDNQTIMTMTYAQNGNILSKTGMGSYTYGSSSRPHAVTEVDNTDGSITLQVQDVGFNYWNKMSSVWATDENNFYSYSVDYGPDLRRVSSEMHRTYQKLYEKFYWDDYEEKVAGSDTLRYYYLNGTNGLEALHIVKTSPNAQPVSQTTKVVTDHLGSITALIDESDYAYIARYDAWGNREIVMPFWFDLTFDRGYTGHEHLDLLGLINMNGRMYDPLLGRFLSPDPYVQAPTDPQNFNRYSYCLNNPLKYTDPDGEYLHLIIGGIIGGFTNWISHDCEFSWKGFWYFNVGALAGAASAAVGGGISSSLAGGSFLAGAAGTTSAMTAGSSFLHGVAIGGSSGFTSGLIAGTGNSIISGDKIGNAFLQGCKEGIIEGSVASFFGGVLGGIDAVMDGRRFWDGAIVENNIVDQSAFVTPSGQGGLRDCGPESVEIVDRSFGGNITAEDIRRQLGGDINDNALGDISTWKKYTEMSHHKYFAEPSKKGRPSNIFSQMRDGWRVAVNLNTGYINHTTGLQEGHSIVMQKATQRIITHLNGMMRYKYIFKAVNPGYPGGSIERISMGQIKRAHNIFYIR